MDVVAKKWLSRLEKASEQVSARDTYCGRGFRDAEGSAEILQCPLYVVSAGLGIVRSDKLIPSYNLTVGPGSINSVRNKVSGSFSPSEWWTKVVTKNPFGLSLKTILARHPDGLILLALSRPYIELLQDELEACTKRQRQRFRFFGKGSNPGLTTTFDNNWMPYDDRLDSIGPGYSGTQTDFAQRALHHFVVEILRTSPNGTPDNHHSLVLKTLSNFRKREFPNRNRLGDEEISKIIRKHWKQGKGHSSALLRIIRRELNIACEQGRFRILYHAVKKTIKGGR